MTTQDHDTDPSTPGAKRLSDPRARAATAVEDTDSRPSDGSSTPDDSAASLAADRSSRTPTMTIDTDRRASMGRTAKPVRPTTDPGIAPPPKLLPIPARPMGIVVPSVVPRASDSIDALLEGISREPSDRRIMAQTDGQRAAWYHTKHAVSAGRGSLDEEPKVVVAHHHTPARVPGQSVRAGRAKGSALDVDPKGWAETTAVLSPTVAGRVFFAVLAALVVVTAIFIALWRSSSERPGASGAVVTVSPAISAPTVPPVQAEPPPPEAPAPAGAPAASTVLAEPPALPLTPSGLTNGLTQKAAPAPKATRTRTKPATSTTKPSGADLGEFKTAL